MSKSAFWLAVIGLVGVNFGPAWNLTIAELADAADASETTLFQPELLVTAWGDAIKFAAIAVFVWLNRNSIKE